MTKSHSENLKVYSRLYRLYWKRRFIYEPRHKAKLFKDYIKHLGLPLHGLRVLDYGFGFGHILFSFDKDNQIYGVELSKEAIEGAKRLARKKRYPEFDFVFSDGTSPLPFNKGSFDLIVCSHVLEHVDKVEDVFDEFEKLLDVNGHLIVLIPIHEKYDDPKHTRQMNLESLSAIASRFNLSCHEPREIDRMNRYVMYFWNKSFHRRLGFLGSVLSGLWNVALILTPRFIFRGMENYLEKKGKEPHQLIVHFRKGH